MSIRAVNDHQVAARPCVDDQVAVTAALRVGVGALIVSLVLVAWFGIRRTKLPWSARILALGVLAALAIGVVVLKQLAHG